MYLDGDRQITLWALYELHYGGFCDVDDRWEWSTECLEVRKHLEHDLERALRMATGARVRSVLDSEGGLADRLFDLVAGTDGPSLSRYIRNHANRDQVEELLIQRSIYNLKEADPHTWAVPRIQGAAKVALVELQFDEYGAGRPDDQHARMFADTLRGVGLNSEYGAYVDVVPAVTLAVNNMMSMFGLQRRLRGAAMGHLAAFEATSSLPARDISLGLARLGLGAAAAYFDEHVEADAVHEQIAMRQICEVMVAEDPEVIDDIVFGAAACLELDVRSAAWNLDRWNQSGSSLAHRQHLQSRTVTA